MEEIAPGSILQRMYLKKRINKSRYKTFCDIGSGNGYVSNILLKMGMKGCGFDLNESACRNNEFKNLEFIKSGRYFVKAANFFNESIENKFDIIISSMVIEHLSDEEINTYLSGNRNVKYKISFSAYYKIFLNEIVLYPFFFLQRIFKSESNSMVIYCEFRLS